MSKIDTSGKRTRRGKGKRKKHCEHCRSLSRTDRHHIVYEPEVIALLCRKCHKKITEWNTKASRMLGHALSNVERVKIWARFMNGAEGVRKSGNVSLAGLTTRNQHASSAPRLSGVGR